MTHSPHSQSGCDDMLLGRLKRGLFQPHWDLFAVLRFLIEGSFERSANQVCDKKVIINLHQGRTNCAREWVSLQKLGACRFPLSSPKPLFTPSVCLLSFNFLRVVKGWHTSQFHYPLQMHHFIIIELFVRAWIPWKRNILLYYNIFFLHIFVCGAVLMHFSARFTLLHTRGKSQRDICLFGMFLSAHDTTVRQSTLPSEQGHHATSASTYPHFHWHALLSSLLEPHWTETMPLQLDDWHLFLLSQQRWEFIRCHCRR